jgi:putative Mg2+ transporter-C (MgtC) family protein
MFPDDLIKLIIAICLGGLIGLEREIHDKAAGFRTLMFICAGSTLFTIFSIRLAGSGDTTRIASTVVTGIGFLGAGVILREAGQIKGLTTASTIWVVAALGMGIGGGYYLYSLVAAILFVIILWFFPSIENLMNRIQQIRTYSVTFSFTLDKAKALEEYFISEKLSARRRSQGKEGEWITISWSVSGKPQKHVRLVDKLFADTEIKEFHYY